MLRDCSAIIASFPGFITGATTPDRHSEYDFDPLPVSVPHMHTAQFMPMMDPLPMMIPTAETPAMMDPLPIVPVAPEQPMYMDPLPVISVSVPEPPPLVMDPLPVVPVDSSVPEADFEPDREEVLASVPEVAHAPAPAPAPAPVPAPAAAAAASSATASAALPEKSPTTIPRSASTKPSRPTAKSSHLAGAGSKKPRAESKQKERVRLPPDPLFSRLSGMAEADMLMGACARGCGCLPPPAASLLAFGWFRACGIKMSGRDTLCRVRNQRPDVLHVLDGQGLEAIP